VEKKNTEKRNWWELEKHGPGIEVFCPQREVENRTVQTFSLIRTKKVPQQKKETFFDK
jgi:hypothetical protein|tara:strand:- start:33 stop:206 length:174 start_codon:yes stop_codon:yes gene_type:complete